MKVLKVILLQGILFLALNMLNACGGGDAASGIGVMACGSTLTKDLTLAEDLDCSGTGGSGLIIGADNIIIDGNGHTITGTYGTPSVDITDPTNIQAGVKNLGYSHVTIKNLRIANFFLGVAEVGLTSELSNITIENNTITNNVLYDLTFIFPSAIVLYNSNQNIISGNQTEGYAYGILLVNSANNYISTNSIIGAAKAGINASSNSTASSTIKNNFIKWSTSIALVLADLNPGSSASVSGNTFLFNYQDMINGKNVNFVNNLSLHNINNRMINFSMEPGNVLRLGDTASFTFKLEDGANNDCPACAYSLATSPSETITSALNGNTITGSFIPSKPGIYSLQISVSDGNENIGKRNFLFYVDSSVTSDLATAKTTYFIRPDIDATHGQFKGLDARSMLLGAPTKTSFERCSQWVISSVDELPDYPFGTINEETVVFWHKESRNSAAYVKRFAHDSINYTSQQSISLSSDYALTELDFNNLAWSMDYPYSWYNLNFEFGIPFGGGTNPYVETTVAQPSTDTIAHVYTTTPAIKSFSNPDALLLAANPSATNSPLATLTLDGSYIQGVGASHSVNVKLDNYSYPFNKDMTKIDSDGTATLIVKDLKDKETLASIAMNIAPAKGYVEITIESWNNGDAGDYTKKWAEVASSSRISVNHIVSQMAANKDYNIYVDGNLYKIETSNSDGVLSFNYISSDSSSHDFFISSECSAKRFRFLLGRKCFLGWWPSNLWPDFFRGCGMLGG